MRRSVRIGASVVGGLAVGTAAAIAIGTFLWDREMARAVDRLRAATPPRALAADAPFSREELAGLPAPVARFFEFALSPGQARVRRARIEQAGEFRGRADAAWSPFTAVEYFSVQPPGFLWDADIRMLPLLATRVRDSYLGEGTTYGKIAGLVPVVDQRGTPEMASGALVRYLAEAVWLPTALLPREGVRWEAIDDSTARASLTDGPTTVSLDVHFGERGEIVRVSTMRYRDVDGTAVLTPWVGYFRDTARIAGMMVPRAGEVEWVLPEGRLPYWRGRIVHSAYEFAPRVQGS